MSAIEDLRSYAKQLQDRFRLGVVARGGALFAAVALVATLVLTVIISRFAFTSASLWSARAALLLALGLVATFGLAIPLWHWSQRWWTRRAEQVFPQFEQRLVTFNERDRDSGEPFLELLATDTMRVAGTADVKAAVSDRVLQTSLVVGVLSLGVLVWLVSAGPGYLGYGAAAIWRGPPSEPFYSLHVNPGDATVRRHADQLVTAEIPGLPSRTLRIHVRYLSATKWEDTTMQQRPATPGFQFLFAGIPEDVEYYVESGSIQTPHFKLRVADIPTVKQIRVTYHHPDWTHLGDTVEEHGGDLRAVEGTEAQLEVVTDRPLTNGLLALDDGRTIALSAAGGGNTVYRASLAIEKDGSYHVATRETVQEQRLSEDYFIQATAVKPPEVAMVRPERDYRASPIEEVTLAATADDPFGLNEFTLHYSVNGGPDQTVNLMKPPDSGTARKLSGSAMLSLETLKLLPGDVIGFYATAKDARSEAHTDISFIQVDPYEREFSQSQQSGGGGGGGGGAADDQAQIAEREKEIIAATWKQAGMKTASSKQAAEQAKFLSDVQTTLRNQATALAGRLEMRDLQLANEQFGSFQQDMQAAAAAMQPAAKKLDGQQWNAAVFDEQKALQYLLRAEATFRQIQVAYGSRGGGSGAVNSAGRDLASLFDLELDTQKNQYESAQSASPQNQQAADVEAALKKLDELARRQSELAQQHSNDTQRSAEERWQQEMLRRQAEELQRQLEQLARNNGQSGESGSASSSSASGQSQDSSGRGQPGGASSSGGTADASTRASAQQALDRLRQAEQDMQRAVDEHNAGDARSAAERLREAMRLLGGIQRQDSSRQVDALAREASRLQNQQKEQADRMRSLINSRMSAQGGAGAAPRPTRDSVEGLINDRQRLADDLARLTRDMRAAEHGAQERSRGASKRLHDAVGDLEQADTETQLQRSADQLRRGYAPLTDDVENQIASELGHLRDQLGDVQQAFAANARANGKGNGDNNGDADARGQRSADADESAAEAMERLRSRLAALDPNMRGLGNEAGNRRGDGQPGQPGADGQTANSGADGQSGGGASQFAGGVYGGGRGNRGGPINGGWNTGNNTELPHAVAPDRAAPPPDTEQVIRQGLQDLDQLRRSVGEDPGARHEIDELVRSMKDLDPKRFPGNPAMVNELYARVLSDLDKLELQLHHNPGDLPPTQVRSDSPQPIPSGYQSAVADYFRRLSQNP